MDSRLTGRRALVTGGSSGIGLAIATMLAEEGCDVILAARGQAALEQAAAALLPLGRRVDTVAVDLSTSTGVQHLADRADAIDILVNNAGAIPPGDLLSLEEAQWRAGWDLKVFGYINLTRLLYARLAERSGVIINVIGAAGERPDPDYIAGSSGNAALIAFTRALGMRSPRDGLRVVGVNPGPVATDRIETLLRDRAERASGDPDRWREAFERTAFGRPAEPSEIAAAVVFLASPLAAYISGTILTIDDLSRDVG